jgi:hypothetical protein
MGIGRIKISVPRMSFCGRAGNTQVSASPHLGIRSFRLSGHGLAPFTNDLGIALPPPVVFSRLAGGLGIANGSYVVLVVTGGPERDMSSATDHCQLTRDQRGECHRYLWDDPIQEVPSD